MASILKVDTIQAPNGTTALEIDTSGRVTRNVVPAFRVGLNADQAETSAATNITVVWNDTNTDNHFIQGGMSLSSGIITVPVAGLYQINTVLRIDDVGSGYIIAKTIVNNDESSNKEQYVISGNPDTSYENLTGSDLVKLSANDTLRVNIYVESDTNWHIANASQFSGVLIG